MNYREKIRKAIECPQFGNETYGEWRALNLEQRKYIKRLLDELDIADNYIKNVYLENKQLKYNWNELKKWLRIKDILANSKINPQSIKFKDLLKHMEYLEKER